MSLLLLMALAVLALGFLLSYQGLDWADKFGSAASLVIAVVALLHPVMSHVSGWFRQSPPVAVMSMSQAQDELAATLARHWAEEDRWRRIHDPRPLPVRYRLERSGITADYSDIVEVFRSLPERRLVILGPAGAGKSVLVVKLARDLLVTRRPDEPVPLILSTATWHPKINITDWIEAELVRGYPALASPVASAEGTTTLGRMLADGGVLPIIDALDELPQPQRVRAIADLSAYGSDRPLVMTSRPDEYEQAIETFGRPLALTETATLSALRIEECQQYLVEATAHDTRWDGVFAELNRDPAGPLAQALTNPLLLWLARAIYEHPDSNPADLLRHSSTEDDIQSHLLGHFIPAVYRDQPGRRSPWRPARAQRWLGYLAEQLRWHEYGEFTQQLAWWRLSPVMTPGNLLRQLARAVTVATVLLWLTQSYRHDPHDFMQTIRSAMDRGPLGRVVLPWIEELIPSIDRVFPGTGHVILQVLPKPGLSYVIWLIALVVLQWSSFFWIPRFLRIPWFDSFWIPWEPSTLEAKPRQMLANLLIGAAVTGFVVPVALWIFDFPVSAGSVALVVAGLSLWSLARNAGSDLSSSATTDSKSPRESLRADRRASIVVAVIRAAALSGLVTLLVGVELGAAFLAMVAMVMVLRHIIGSNRRSGFACERYARARLVRWLLRQVPWRLMTFLADAHQRGVLRQAGAVYQFRHVRLLEHLAGPGDEWLAGNSRLSLYVDRLERLRSRIANRVMAWGEGGWRHGAAPGLRVTREGFSWTYRDPRLDRWPRTRQRNDQETSRLWRLEVVVDQAGTALGQRPSRWHLVVAAAILPFGGPQRARRYLARRADPLLPAAEVIRDMDDLDLRIVELIRSSTLGTPMAIQPGEILRREIRRHPYFLIRTVAWTSLAAITGAVLTLRAFDGMNLFEFAGLLVSVLGIARGLWDLIQYRGERFLITDWRIIADTGLMTRWASELPLAGISDIACDRSLPGAIWDFGTIRLTADPDISHIAYTTPLLGRLLGYGAFSIMESSGDILALSLIESIPDPVSTYRLLIDAVEARRDNQDLSVGANSAAATAARADSPSSYSDSRAQTHITPVTPT